MFLPSVVLLEIDLNGVATLKFKRDAPGTVHVDRIAHRLEAFERVEIESRNMHFLRPEGCVEAVKSGQDALVQPGVDPCGAALGPEVGEGFAFE